MKFLFSISFLLPLFAQTTFDDLSENHIHQEAIYTLFDEGIVEGYSDGTFKPDGTINRVEFVKILVESSSELINNCKNSKKYQDTDANAWYSEYLNTATCEGLVEGYPDGTFRPASPINYAEASKILTVSIMGEGVGETKGAWYEKYTNWIENEGAKPRKSIKPEDEITRGEMAEMIYRLTFALEGNMTKENCYDDEYYDEEDRTCYLEETEETKEDLTAWLGFSAGHSAPSDLPEGTLYIVVDNEIVIVSGEAYPADAVIWEEFTKLIPQRFRSPVSQFLVYEENDDTSAFVSPQDGENNDQWVLAVNILDSMFSEDEEIADWREFQVTLVHEFFHVHSLNDKELNANTAENACKLTYFTDEGCANKTAIINKFVDKFWTKKMRENEGDDFGSVWYDENPKDFVNKYAATNPGEDIAESFAFFVFKDKPTSAKTKADEKLLFFYDFPELVSLRNHVRAQIKNKN